MKNLNGNALHKYKAAQASLLNYMEVTVPIRERLVERMEQIESGRDALDQLAQDALADVLGIEHGALRNSLTKECKDSPSGKCAFDMDTATANVCVICKEKDVGPHG